MNWKYPRDEWLDTYKQEQTTYGTISPVTSEEPWCVKAGLIKYHPETKALLATYFDLRHSQLHNPKAIHTYNCAQLAFLMVATSHYLSQMHHTQKRFWKMNQHLDPAEAVLHWFLFNLLTRMSSF